MIRVLLIVILGIFLLATDFSIAGVKNTDSQFLRCDFTHVLQKIFFSNTPEFISLLPDNIELEFEAVEKPKIIVSGSYKIKNHSFSLFNIGQNTIIPLFNDLPPPLFT